MEQLHVRVVVNVQLIVVKRQAEGSLGCVFLSECCDLSLQIVLALVGVVDYCHLKALLRVEAATVHHQPSGLRVQLVFDHGGEGRGQGDPDVDLAETHKRALFLHRAKVMHQREEEAPRYRGTVHRAQSRHS